MPRFQAEPAYAHGTPAKTAVVLVNLGTPDAPTAPALKKYLKQFLSDRRLVEIPKPIWWLILNGIILNLRPKKSAEKYASIWTPQGSPLRVHTEAQTRALRADFAEMGLGDVRIEYAMRYGSPGIAEVLDQLRADNCTRILVLPLYPQFAGSTTASVFDEVALSIRRWRNQPALRLVRNYHDHPAYIAALAGSIRDYWAVHGEPDKLVMSFHGVPRFSLDKGDPYHCECHKTARLVSEALGLPKERWMTTFQSRFGKAEWLKPYTQPTIEELAKKGVGRVDVVCPGFTSDCLETLEEIAMEVKSAFLQNGGREFHYIPCLNDRPQWIAALTEIATAELGNWLTIPRVSPEESRLCAERAKALGATR